MELQAAECRLLNRLRDAGVGNTARSLHRACVRLVRQCDSDHQRDADRAVIAMMTRMSGAVCLRNLEAPNASRRASCGNDNPNRGTPQ